MRTGKCITTCSVEQAKHASHVLARSLCQLICNTWLYVRRSNDFNSLPVNKLQLALVALSVACCISCSLAVTCGSLGDIPLSGCSACDAVNITHHHHNHSDWTKSATGRKMLHWHGNHSGGNHTWHHHSSWLVPSCTACEAGYVLSSGFGHRHHEGSSGGSNTRPQHCGKPMAYHAKHAHACCCTYGAVAVNGNG